MIPKKVVISGGPCTGKTSIINVLEKKGYSCSHEFSRHVIEEEQKAGSGVVPWENVLAFSERIIDGRVQQFHDATKELLTFFDRSIIDVIAYLEHDNIKIPDTFEEIAVKFRYYPKIFITPFWKEIYETDNQRIEPIEKAMRLEKNLVAAYKKYGYTVIMIPKDTIDNRIGFILQNLI